MTNVSIEVQLKPAQAEAYLNWLTIQFQLLMTDCWYDDKYRYTPQGLRSPKILEDHPHIAGLNRTRRELLKQLKAEGVLA